MSVSKFTYTDNTSDSNDKTMENLHKQIIIDFNFEEWFNYNHKLIQDLKEKIFSEYEEAQNERIKN